jgi:hypothetical protein
MNIDTFSLPPPLLNYNVPKKQIIFKINNKYDYDYDSNDIIAKLKNLNVSSTIHKQYNIKYNNIIGENEFKNIN